MKHRTDNIITAAFVVVMASILIFGTNNVLNMKNEKDAAEAERQEKHIEQLESETYKHYDLTDAEFIEEEPTTYMIMTPEEFEVVGVIFFKGWKFTYYSEQVLPGEGLTIPGRWSDGKFVRDEDGFLCVASNEHPYGSKVETPFGMAKVYDMVGDDVTGVIDIYVSW